MKFFFQFYWIFFNKAEFSNFLCQNLRNHLEIRKFYNLSFFNSSESVLESKQVFFCCSFRLIFCHVDPHVFSDSDPGNQNLADPTDPYPKHWKMPLWTCHVTLWLEGHLTFSFKSFKPCSCSRTRERNETEISSLKDALREARTDNSVVLQVYNTP